MVNPAPTPAPSKKVDRKVKLATFASYLAGVALLAIVGGIQGHLDVITSAFPAWIDVIITPIIPTAITFITGYVTSHTPQDLNLAVKR